MSIDDRAEPKEDMQIIQPDGSRACLNWELPDSKIVDTSYCLWRRTYDDNKMGIGTTFLHNLDTVECRFCDGYDNKCKKYITEE